MPHLTLEYSANVNVESDFAGLFGELHDLLADAGGIRIGNCKSRAYIAREFYVGSGDEKSGFVHLDIRFLEGRSSHIKQSIGKMARDILIEWFRSSAEELEMQITVEVRDIERSFYFKYPEGTFTPGV